MAIRRQQMVHLSSRNSSRNGSRNSDLSFYFPELYRKSSGTVYAEISLHNAQIPMSFYLIDTDNNRVTINGLDYVLRDGNYDALSFIDMFNDLGSPVVLSVDVSQIRYTLTGLASFTFSTNAGEIMGFESDVVYASDGLNLKAPFVCDMGGVRKILLTSSVLGTGVFGDSNGLKNVMASIPLSSSLGGLLSYENVQKQANVISRTSLDNFDLQLRDQSYRLIDFNGSHVDISLLIEIFTNDIPAVSMSIGELEAMIRNQQNAAQPPPEPTEEDNEEPPSQGDIPRN